MVVTVVAAHVAEERGSEFRHSFAGATADLPPGIVQTFLLRAPESHEWRILTVWRSREELEAYRAAVEVPEAIRMFRAVGSEPVMGEFDVLEQAVETAGA
ncbi:MAG TPA: antibiotic biosynthesis monooxygenase [Actinomycetota bacterium]